MPKKIRKVMLLFSSQAKTSWISLYVIIFYAHICCFYLREMVLICQDKDHIIIPCVNKIIKKGNRNICVMLCTQFPHFFDYLSKRKRTKFIAMTVQYIWYFFKCIVYTQIYKRCCKIIKCEKLTMKGTNRKQSAEYRLRTTDFIQSNYMNYYSTQTIDIEQYSYSIM